MRRFEDRVFSLDLEEEELLKNAVRNSREQMCIRDRLHTAVR